MENNEMNNIEILEEQNEKDNVIQQASSLNELNNEKQNLTNEQKLEYLSNLIKKAEQNLEEKDISKTIVTKDNNLLL